jgi:hypothetical protein
MEALFSGLSRADLRADAPPMSGSVGLFAHLRICVSRMARQDNAWSR